MKLLLLLSLLAAGTRCATQTEQLPFAISETLSIDFGRPYENDSENATVPLTPAPTRAPVSLSAASDPMMSLLFLVLSDSVAAVGVLGLIAAIGVISASVLRPTGSASNAARIRSVASFSSCALIPAIAPSPLIFHPIPVCTITGESSATAMLATGDISSAESFESCAAQTAALSALVQVIFVAVAAVVVRLTRQHSSDGRVDARAAVIIRISLMTIGFLTPSVVYSATIQLFGGGYYNATSTAVIAGLVSLVLAGALQGKCIIAVIWMRNERSDTAVRIDSPADPVSTVILSSVRDPTNMLCGCLVGAELWLAIVLAAMSGAKATVNGLCIPLTVIAGVLIVLHLVYVVKIKPHQQVRDRNFAIFFSASEVVMLFVGAISASSFSALRALLGLLIVIQAASFAVQVLAMLIHDYFVARHGQPVLLSGQEEPLLHLDETASSHELSEKQATLESFVAFDDGTGAPARHAAGNPLEPSDLIDSANRTRARSTHETPVIEPSSSVRQRGRTSTRREFDVASAAHSASSYWSMLGSPAGGQHYTVGVRSAAEGDPLVAMEELRGTPPRKRKATQQQQTWTCAYCGTTNQVIPEQTTHWHESLGRIVQDAYKPCSTCFSPPPELSRTPDE